MVKRNAVSTSSGSGGERVVDVVAVIGRPPTAVWVGRHVYSGAAAALATDPAMVVSEPQSTAGGMSRAPKQDYSVVLNVERLQQGEDRRREQPLVSPRGGGSLLL